MLKKLTVLALILAMVFTLGACKLIVVEKYVEEEEPPAESPYGGKPGTEGYREEEPVPTMPVLEEDDPEYEQIMLMYRGVAPLGAYSIVYPEVLDNEDMSSDDFWLLLAMVAHGTAPAEYFDAVGNVDMPKEQIPDYAMTFFSAYYEKNGVPSFENSYAASSDPKGTVVTLLAMSIDSYEPQLVGFWRESEDDYVLVIDYRPISAGEEGTEEGGEAQEETASEETAAADGQEDDYYIRQVARISRWNEEEGEGEEKAEHYFAFRLVSIGDYEGFPGEEGTEDQ